MQQSSGSFADLIDALLAGAGLPEAEVLEVVDVASSNATGMQLAVLESAIKITASAVAVASDSAIVMPDELEAAFVEVGVMAAPMAAQQPSAATASSIEQSETPRVIQQKPGGVIQLLAAALGYPAEVDEGLVELDMEAEINRHAHLKWDQILEAHPPSFADKRDVGEPHSVLKDVVNVVGLAAIAIPLAAGCVVKHAWDWLWS
jgi:hypothetical protein